MFAKFPLENRKRERRTHRSSKTDVNHIGVCVCIACGCDGAMKGSHVVVVVFAAGWYTVSGRTPSLFMCWLFISTELQSTGQIVTDQSERILTDVYCGGFSSFESRRWGVTEQ